MGDVGLHNILNTILRRDRTPIFLFGETHVGKAQVDTIKLAMESFEGVMNYKAVDLWFPKTDAGRYAGYKYNKMVMYVVSTGPLEYLVCTAHRAFVHGPWAQTIETHPKLLSVSRMCVKKFLCLFFTAAGPGHLQGTDRP